MGRLRVVFGSLAGAAAIHIALIACSARRADGDAGIVDAALDALATIGDAETSDARAQESGACSCAAPARTTFAGALDLGSGTVVTRSQASSASSSVERYIFASGDTGYRIAARASFWTAGSSLRYTLDCVLYSGGNGSPLRAPSTCSLTEERDGAAVWSASASASGTAVEISDTVAEVRINDLAATSAARTLTARGFRFRSSATSGIIPPIALEPM